MFEAYSTSHLVVLGVFVVGVVVLLAIGPLVRERPTVARPIAVALAVGNIAFGLVGTVTELDPDDIAGNLPLQLCDFAWIPVAWALLTSHRGRAGADLLLGADPVAAGAGAADPRRGLPRPQLLRVLGQARAARVGRRLRDADPAPGP